MSCCTTFEPIDAIINAICAKCVNMVLVRYMYFFGAFELVQIVAEYRLLLVLVEKGAAFHQLVELLERALEELHARLHIHISTHCYRRSEDHHVVLTVEMLVWLANIRPLTR